MSDPDRNLLQRAAAHVVDFFEWVGDSLDSEEARRAIYFDLGLDSEGAPELALPPEHVESIKAYRDSSDVDFQAFVSTWGDIVALLEAIDSFVSVDPDSTQDEIQEYTYRVATILGTEFVRLRYPFWAYLAQLFRFLVDRPGRVEEALSRLDSDDDAATLTATVLLSLALLLSYWEKAPWPASIVTRRVDLPEHKQLFGWDLDPSSPTPIADRLSERMFSFRFEGKVTEPAAENGGSVAGKVGATLAWVPGEHGGPGLFLALHGAEETTASLSPNWRLKVKFASAGAVDFLIWKGVDVNGPSDASASFTIETTRKTDEKGPYLLGVGRGTRLEVTKATITGQIGASGALLKAVSKKSRLVMAMADADPFVERSIPAREVSVDIDFGLGVSTQKGLFLEGGSGLSITLPVNHFVGVDVRRPRETDSLNIGVRLRQLHMTLSGGKSGSEVRTEFLCTFDVNLGSLTATIDRLGFAAGIDARDRDAPVIGYRGPTGIGLVIGKDPVKGGGYLFADVDLGQYAGAGQLDIKCIILSAIGLLTTKMPDGSRGYSLLLVVNLTDISWPFFSGLVTGVGVLVGLNRTAQVEELRAGLKNRSLDAILFPENPVANAARYVTALQTVMPARDGQLMVGLLAQFAWGGSARWATLELGVIIEGDDPWRVLVLGQVRVLLPHEKKVLARLQGDFLGVIDWQRNTISFDAVLYDSRILTYALTGDIALRARWAEAPTLDAAPEDEVGENPAGQEEEPCFLLAIGGFHPDFAAPASFPKLNRIAFTITRGESARLTLAGYFGLTSNTIQFGSRTDFFVRAAGFSVEGYLGYDTLYCPPFEFVVDIQVGVTVKWHGRTLVGFEAELTFSGPSSWHVRGRVTIEVWRFTIGPLCFDKTLGDGEPPTALPDADPLPALVAALEDPRSWGAELTPRSSSVVALGGGATTGELLVHPLGALSVRQQVVPLGIEIDRFGSARLAGERRFDLAVHTANGDEAGGGQPIVDYFAAAQFLDLSDSAKLKRPSFELMQAGVRIGRSLAFGGELDPTLIGEAPIEYEVVPPRAAEDAENPAQPLEVTPEELQAIIAMEAYRSPANRAAGPRFPAPSLGVRVARPRYVVARKSDLEPVALTDLDKTGAPSYTAAAQALWRHEQEVPASRDELQVITVLAGEGVGS